MSFRRQLRPDQGNRAPSPGVPFVLQKVGLGLNLFLARAFSVEGSNINSLAYGSTAIHPFGAAPLLPSIRIVQAGSS